MRHVRSVIVQRTFCPFLIRYICVLSVIHPLLIRQSPLVDRSLSVTYPLHMSYACVLCAPYTFREDPHRHRDDFHHRTSTGFTFFFIFFCPFGVRYPYPVICDSTINEPLLDMRFLTMWYVRPAEPQISLRIRAV